MFQKLSQNAGRWWMVARFRSHVRRNSRQWAIGAICAAVWLALIVGVALLRTFFGGGPDRWGKVLPVAGQVLLEGQPLHGGIVKYHADASKGNEIPFAPSGEIDTDGNYVLYTANKKGAPPGWYRVVVVPAETTDNSKESRKGSKLPFNAKFTHDDQTTLRVEVKENGDYKLELTK
ncbi:MAG TPA: hypothetical protein VH682_02335 [Gemmataceae bacterium]|jgi:hypothetical protein